MSFKIKVDKYDKDIVILHNGQQIAKMNDQAFANMAEVIVKYLVGRGYRISNPMTATRGILALVFRILGNIYSWIPFRKEKQKK